MTESASLADKVRVGFAFSSGSYAIRVVLDFATSVALARILFPEDFGVVAVAATFLQLSYVVGNLGMGGAVVQARELSNQDRHSAYTISTATGLLLTLLCTSIAPWASRFFAMPVLRAAMPIMALQVLLAGLAATPNALLRRDLRLGRLAFVEISTSLSYAVTGIGLAALGYGVWSLVWAPIISGLWNLALLHGVTGFWPRPSLAWHSTRRLLGFGGTLTIKNIFVHLARHSDNLVVAKLLGDASTGLYTRAFNLSTLPQTRLVTLLYSVCFPAFCRLRENEDRFRDWYVKATAGVAVVVSPLLLGLFVVAEDFTLVVFGEKWVGMVPSLRLLCLAGLLNSLHMLGGAAIEASGHLRYEVVTQCIYAILIPVGSIVGARHGIEGVSWAILGAAATLYAMKSLTLKAAIGLPPRRYLMAVGPSTLAGIVMCLAVSGVLSAMEFWWPTGSLSIKAVRLSVGISTGAGVYIAGMLLIGPEHFRMVLEQFRLLFKRTRGAVLQTDAASSGG